MFVHEAGSRVDPESQTNLLESGGSENSKPEALVNFHYSPESEEGDVTSYNVDPAKLAQYTANAKPTSYNKNTYTRKAPGTTIELFEGRYDQSIPVNETSQEEPGMAGWLDIEPGSLADQYPEYAEFLRDLSEYTPKQDVLNELQYGVYRDYGEEGLQKLYSLDARVGDNVAESAQTENKQEEDKTTSTEIELFSREKVLPAEIEKTTGIEITKAVEIETEGEQKTARRHAFAEKMRNRARNAMQELSGNYQDLKDAYRGFIEGGIHPEWNKHSRGELNVALGGMAVSGVYEGEVKSSNETLYKPTMNERFHGRFGKAVGGVAVASVLVAFPQVENNPSIHEETAAAQQELEESSNVNVEAAEYLLQKQSEASASIETEEGATQDSANAENVSSTESAESGSSSLVDVSEKYGLPAGYLQHTGEFYQVEAMTHAPTNSITDASEHILRDHFRRDPSTQEVANLAKLIGDRHLEEGEKLHIRKEDIDTIYEAYDVELNGTREDYVKNLAGVAHKVGREYDIPYEAILAQSAHESNWGQSGLTRDANNFFGIKTGSRWNGASHTLPTREVIDGRSVTVGADFRAYGNTYEGLKGYAEFIHNTPLYHEALNHPDDPIAYIQKIYEAGYATDPTYVAKTNATLHEVRTYLAGMTGPQTETDVPQYEEKPEPAASSQEVAAASVSESEIAEQGRSRQETVEQGEEIDISNEELQDELIAVKDSSEAITVSDIPSEVSKDIADSLGNVVKFESAETRIENDAKAEENTENAGNHTAEEPKPEDVQEQEKEQPEPEAEQASTSQPEPKPEPAHETAEREPQYQFPANPEDTERISSCYGMRHHPIYGETRLHAGLDIGAPEGAPVLAADEGVVVERNIGHPTIGYGQRITLQHPDGSRTLYAHNSALGPEVGDHVEKGQLIARVGSTGGSTGPHIHLEKHNRDANGNYYPVDITDDSFRIPDSVPNPKNC